MHPRIISLNTTTSAYDDGFHAYMKSKCLQPTRSPLLTLLAMDRYGVGCLALTVPMYDANSPNSQPPTPSPEASPQQRYRGAQGGGQAEVLGPPIFTLLLLAACNGIGVVEA